MLFFFKEKPIVLDCFTYRSYVYELFPIEKATKHWPEWWKALPNESEGNNMKGCQGLIGQYQHGFVIPLWTDIRIDVDPEKRSGTFRFADEISQVHVHPHKQSYGFLDYSEYMHFKLLSPWHFQSKDEVDFYWGSPVWNLNGLNFDITVLPGIVNYKYQHGTNINIIVNPRIGERQIEIFCGQAMVHGFPISERKLEIRKHLISRDEFDKRTSKFGSGFSFGKKYSKVKKIIDSRESEKKCPFGFGRK